MEEAQAEPWTDYYTCFEPGSMLLVDSTWRLPTTSTEGTISLRLHRLDLASVDGAQGIGFLHGAVFTIADEHGLPLLRSG